MTLYHVLGELYAENRALRSELQAALERLRAIEPMPDPKESPKEPER